MHHQRQFSKGGSDPRSNDRNEAGLWRPKGCTNRGRSRPSNFCWRLCFAHEFLSSHRPTHFFQPMDPGAGRTVHRIMVFAATVHLCFMLISPCQRRRTAHTRDPGGRSRNLLNSCLGSLNSPRERHRPHLAIADKVRYTPALETRPTLLAAGPTLLYQKNLSPVAQANHEPESARTTARYRDLLATHSSSPLFPHKRLKISSAFGNIRSSAAT